MKASRPEVGRPTLQPSDVGNANAAVLTIATVEFRESNFTNERSGKKETKCVLTFAEVPDREKWVGKRGTVALIDHYGDETDKWIGKPVPFVKLAQNVGGKQTIGLSVAAGEPPLDWDGVLKEFAVRSKKGK